MAEESKFKVGDTVQLNSGSPTLTISRTGLTHDSDWVEVIWFKDGDFHVKNLNAELLSKADSGLV